METLKIANFEIENWRGKKLHLMIEKSLFEIQIFIENLIVWI